MKKGKSKWKSFKHLFKKEPESSQTSSSSNNSEPEVEWIFEIETPPIKEYKILGLENNITDREVKERYRYLIKQYHPDNGGDAKEFIKIKKAYEKIMESRAVK